MSMPIWEDEFPGRAIVDWSRRVSARSPLLVRRVERAEVFQDFGLQFLGVDRAVVAPKDFTAGGDEDGVRERAGPLGIEGLHERVGAGAGVEEISRGAAFGREQALEARGGDGVLVLQKFLRLRQHLRIVH